MKYDEAHYDASNELVAHYALHLFQQFVRLNYFY
jgi:hypothetical protein